MIDRALLSKQAGVAPRRLRVRHTRFYKNVWHPPTKKLWPDELAGGKVCQRALAPEKTSAVELHQRIPLRKVKAMVGRTGQGFRLKELVSDCRYCYLEMKGV